MIISKTYYIFYTFQCIYVGPWPSLERRRPPETLEKAEDPGFESRRARHKGEIEKL